MQNYFCKTVRDVWHSIAASFVQSSLFVCISRNFSTRNKTTEGLILLYFIVSLLLLDLEMFQTSIMKAIALISALRRHKWKKQPSLKSLPHTDTTDTTTNHNDLTLHQCSSYQKFWPKEVAVGQWGLADYQKLLSSQIDGASDDDFPLFLCL